MNSLIYHKDECIITFTFFAVMQIFRWSIFVFLIRFKDLMCIRISARMFNQASTWFDELTNRRSASGQFWLKGRGRECGGAAFSPSP